MTLRLKSELNAEYSVKFDERKLVDLDSNGILISSFDLSSFNLLYMNSSDPKNKHCEREISNFLKNKNNLLILMSSEEWENCMENEEIKNKLNLPHFIGQRKFGMSHALIAICFNEKCTVKLSHESNFYGEFLYKINLDDFLKEATNNLFQESPRFINNMSSNSSNSSDNESYNSNMSNTLTNSSEESEKNNSNNTNRINNSDRHQNKLNNSNIKETQTNETKEKNFESYSLESYQKNDTSQNSSSKTYSKNATNNISSENHTMNKDNYKLKPRNSIRKKDLNKTSQNMYEEYNNNKTAQNLVINDTIKIQLISFGANINENEFSSIRANNQLIHASKSCGLHVAIMDPCKENNKNNDMTEDMKNSLEKLNKMYTNVVDSFKKIFLNIEVSCLDTFKSVNIFSKALDYSKSIDFNLYDEGAKVLITCPSTCFYENEFIK